MRTLPRRPIEGIKSNELVYGKHIAGAQKWYFPPSSPPGERRRPEELCGPTQLRRPAVHE